jgi:hypothetical protein
MGLRAVGGGEPGVPSRAWKASISAKWTGSFSSIASAKSPGSMLYSRAIRSVGVASVRQMFHSTSAAPKASSVRFFAKTMRKSAFRHTLPVARRPTVPPRSTGTSSSARSRSS